ncbi:hypothetical protein CAOG_02199 [Capsaspora owczarzaki ATCC 30864]|uniref:Cytochrome P450 n=1 Tax=Capsaspora owczarzaki (strain ATCC 30864) TaxID=595528 RepID=A0A0D2X1K9_CAPO3|nr:hypothetical protein CAOG_02199 [Capsaspora owczarzaki ATCC 30864]KJE90989.1 hypothetical protein CAOG_002199 [Capsaspora owczarzaki ATCC 30864]|eukprot:XP_004348949.2 hypothetical protein CAOG_02199 [Capsaspora owczarzaki ATCC 30864]
MLLLTELLVAVACVLACLLLYVRQRPPRRPPSPTDAAPKAKAAALLSPVAATQQQQQQRRPAASSSPSTSEQPNLEQKPAPPPPSAPPRVSGGYWYFGHAFALAFNPVAFWQACREEYGPVFSCTVMGKPYTFLSDDDGPRFFLNVPPSSLAPATLSDDPARSFFPAYFFAAATSEARDWMHTALAEYSRRPTFPAVVQECVEGLDEFWDKMGSHGELRLFDTMEEAAFRVATIAYGGRELQGEFFHEWKSYFVDTDLQSGFLTGKTQMFDPRLWWRRSMVFNGLERLLERIVERRLLEGGDLGGDYIALLIRQAQHESQSADSVASTVPQRVLARLFMTVSDAFMNAYIHAAWTLVHVLSTPALTYHVAAEIENAGKSTTGAPAATGLIHSLPLVDASIEEMLRLSTSGVTIRTLSQAVPYGAFLIPAGHTVATTAFFRHHNAEIYPSPAQFNPLRFLPSNFSLPSPKSPTSPGMRPSSPPLLHLHHPHVEHPAAHHHHHHHHHHPTHITRDGSVVLERPPLAPSTTGMQTSQLVDTSEEELSADEGSDAGEPSTAPTPRAQQGLGHPQRTVVADSSSTRDAASASSAPPPQRAVPDSAIAELPYTNIPFNGRYCACVGRMYMTTFTKVLLSVAITRFELSFAGEPPAIPNSCLTVVTKPSRDCLLRYQSREAL